MNRMWIGIIVVMAILIAFVWWWNSTKVKASSIDCVNNICMDKKGQKIPLWECTKIGLTC